MLAIQENRPWDGLYLPRVWVKDKGRCKEAGIPKEEMVFKNKVALALQMIAQARDHGLRYAWVGADSLNGQDPVFRNTLEESGEVFVVDVHRDQRVYLQDPAPHVPEPRGERGRKRTRLKTDAKALRVDQWAQRQPEDLWKKVTLRASTRGDLIVEVLHRRVWVWDGKQAAARCCHLLVRRDKPTQSDYKYSLSNAPVDISVERLAIMQGQRFWIERAFEDAKSEAGMGDYQIRGWRAWHHHMALVMMAMLFMLEERIRQGHSVPLLSCSDIETLLAHFLPRRDPTEEEILRQLVVRHQKRKASIDSAYRNRDPSHA